ncbi:MAG: cysteine hydrolase [Deltaproteobacteria bacterium]|nr:cysteine hydrolase [Deltaproteobacteria bacterium]
MRREIKSALLVIDVQNYFFEKKAYAYISGVQRLIKPINSLIKKFSENKSAIFFTRQVFPKSISHPMRRWWKRLPWGNECELYRGLYLPENKCIIEKEYYSAFFRTDLNRLLRKKKITRLFFCGVMTHLCVETSIRDAFMQGYDCFLVEDATMSKNSVHHRASVINLGHGFCRIIRSREINEYL